MDGAADARAAAGRSLAAEVVSSFGQVCLRVNGSSMLPSVWPGDTLTICRTDVATVRPGQIVLFRCNGWLLAHRVVGKAGRPGEQFLITRGDSLSRVDPPVSSEELLGTVTSIVRRGRRIIPRLHLTFYERALSFILRHSERATSLLLRLSQISTDNYVVSRFLRVLRALAVKNPAQDFTAKTRTTQREREEGYEGIS